MPNEKWDAVLGEGRQSNMDGTLLLKFFYALNLSDYQK